MRTITENDIRNRTREIAEAHAQMPQYSVSDFLMIRELALKELRELGVPNGSAGGRSMGHELPLRAENSTVPQNNMQTVSDAYYGRTPAEYENRHEMQNAAPYPAQTYENAEQGWNRQHATQMNSSADTRTGNSTPAPTHSQERKMSAFEILRNAGDKWN
jgi:hypothetical protein